MDKWEEMDKLEKINQIVWVDLDNFNNIIIIIQNKIEKVENLGKVTGRR